MFMQLQDLLITEQATVKEAIEQLERVRCKVVYVVKDKKLLASVSDGDVRRYILRAGDIECSISQIAYYSPRAFREYEREAWQELFQRTEMYSVPIVNLNEEIIGVVFKNGTYIKEHEKIGLPVVIMAGGKGTRLHPYTKILPKALIPIGELPISEHIIQRFLEYGCSQYYMIVNHKGAMIQSYFNNIDKAYDIRFIEEAEPLGTGGGLSLLKGSIEQDFILTNCDILIDADYGEIYRIHKKKNNFITMVLSEYEVEIPYGVVQVDQDNNYGGVTEKPVLHYLINTGVYLVNERVITEMPRDTVMDFPDIVESYRKSGEKIGCYVVKQSAYMDMGQFEELEKMKEKLHAQ